MRQLRAAESELVKSEHRAIAFGDLLYERIIVMRARRGRKLEGLGTRAMDRQYAGRPWPPSKSG